MDTNPKSPFSLIRGVLLLLLISLIFAGYYFFFRPISRQEVNLTGTSAYCTFSKDNYLMESHSKGGKTRSVTTADGRIDHLVDDGETTYLWQEGQSVGIKIYQPYLAEFDNVEEPDPSVIGKTPQDLGMTVKCLARWFPDSIFQPPQNIQFTESQGVTAGVKP